MKFVVFLVSISFFMIGFSNQSLDDLRSLVPSNTLVFSAINNTCPQGFDYLNDQTGLCFRRGLSKQIFTRASVECIILESHICDWQEYSLINFLRPNTLEQQERFWTSALSTSQHTDYPLVITYRGTNILHYNQNHDSLSFFCCRNS